MPVEFRDYYQILCVSRGERTRFWKELSRVSHFNPGQINKRHFEETMKMFGNSIEKPVTTVQLFEPDAPAVYTLEQVASLTTDTSSGPPAARPVSLQLIPSSSRMPIVSSAGASRMKLAGKINYR